MRIQHNIAALNSHRQLGANNNAVSKNLEKLSSGYKINRAGDDAAGLAISEKMRAQIKGLETATKNANDGISLVQTAEGALTEVHSMLNRMVELATQSANGTYDNEVDRKNLQKEVESLKSEIDRIAESTNYNGINLLDGSMGEGATGATGKLTGGGTPDVSFIAEEGWSLTFADGKAASNDDVAVSGKDITITLGTKDSAKTYTEADINKLLADAGITAKVKLSKDITTAAAAEEVSMGKITSAKATNAKATVGGIDFEAMKAGNITSNVEVVKNASASSTGVLVDEKTGDVKITLNGDEDLDTINKMLTDAGANVKATKVGTIATGSATALSGGTGIAGDGLELQVGDTAEKFNKVAVKVGNMSSNSLGIGSISVADQDKASDAIAKIKTAINTVSGTRGDLGAIQNRLEHTINNLGVASENMTAAESRIRDVDMAKEMMDFTKNNILTQASQAMLAQANQLPQGVLQLLQ
ncbi:flagellin [Anaerotignum propionicum]|uniref:flagellin N-terminal helical domain-containing protein n=1 Tax=Anaerotignum propionicum TaxID=28446 RepID=UPI00210B6C2D|nr:flagellin [Anaerotignum propionicum]MCQ4936622.1 flagellin [Anaerotignum propionicum]